MSSRRHLRSGLRKVQRLEYATPGFADSESSDEDSLPCHENNSEDAREQLGIAEDDHEGPRGTRWKRAFLSRMEGKAEEAFRDSHERAKQYIARRFPRKSMAEIYAMVPEPIIDSFWTEEHEADLHRVSNYRSVAEWINDPENKPNPSLVNLWRRLIRVRGVFPTEIVGAGTYIQYEQKLALTGGATVPHPFWPESFARRLANLALGSPCGPDLKLLSIMLRWFVAALEYDCVVERRRILLEGYDNDVPFLRALDEKLQQCPHQPNWEVHKTVRKNFEREKRNIPWHSEALRQIEIKARHYDDDGCGHLKPPKAEPTLVQESHYGYPVYELGSLMLCQIAQAFDAMSPVGGHARSLGTMMEGHMVWDAICGHIEPRGDRVWRNLRLRVFEAEMRLVERRKLDAGAKVDISSTILAPTSRKSSLLSSPPESPLMSSNEEEDRATSTSVLPEEQLMSTMEKEAGHTNTLVLSENDELDDSPADTHEINDIPYIFMDEQPEEEVSDRHNLAITSTIPHEKIPRPRVFYPDPKKLLAQTMNCKKTKNVNPNKKRRRSYVWDSDSTTMDPYETWQMVWADGSTQ